MLSARACITSALAVALVSCCRLGPDEKRVVGTWELSGIDFTSRVVFHCNHRSEELFPRERGLLAKISSWEVGARGTWRLEGDTIILDEHPFYMSPSAKAPFPRRTYRMKIVEFRPNELIRDGGSPLNRVN
jgi:hypothetical protein